MIQRNAWKLSIALLAAMGCGDDDEGGKTDGPGAPSSGAACADICEGMRAARCNVDLARCESLCEQQYAATPASCRATADQLLDCASKATFSCGAEGPEATFCRELETRLDLCSGGVAVDAGTQPALDGGAPVQDAGATPVGDGAATATGDASSLPVSRADGGADASASGDASASSDAASPQDAGPVQAISCQPAADDNACDRCIKGSCCSEVQACGRDCQLLGACVADCETDACYEACAQQHPAGFDQFDAVLTCTTDECESACDDTTPEPNGARPPPANCLPTFAPEGTCSDPSRPIGYDCKGAPFPGCVALPDISDVYCCARS